MKSIYFLATYHNQIHLQFSALSFLWNALPYIKMNTVNEDEMSPFSISSLPSTLMCILSARDLNDKSSYNNIG